MLELAGGSVHALSYQQARNNRAVVGQVYVAEPGYMLGRAAVPKFALITALDGVPTPDLNSFAVVLRSLRVSTKQLLLLIPATNNSYRVCSMDVPLPEVALCRSA